LSAERPQTNPLRPPGVADLLAHVIQPGDDANDFVQGLSIPRFRSARLSLQPRGLAGQRAAGSLAPSFLPRLTGGDAR
jgi:hypothetical protein